MFASPVWESSFHRLLHPRDQISRSEFLFHLLFEREFGKNLQLYSSDLTEQTITHSASLTWITRVWKRVSEPESPAARARAHHQHIARSSEHHRSAQRGVSGVSKRFDLVELPGSDRNKSPEDTGETLETLNGTLGTLPNFNMIERFMQQISLEFIWDNGHEIKAMHFDYCRFTLY